MTQGGDASKLVAHIQASQAEECERVREEAREQARTLVTAARETARRKVHVTISRERELLAREETLAAARLHTAQRTTAQRRQQALLAEAMRRLHDALEQQWLQRDAAAAWLGRALDTAREQLADGEWELVHGETWMPMHAELCGEMLWQTEWRDSLDARIRAGLRIKCNGVVVDATLNTLLDDSHLQTWLLVALGVENCEVPTRDE